MKYKQIIAFVLLLMCILIFIDPTASENVATPTDIEEEDPQSSSLFVTKKLVGEIWHVRCDYMDGETFHAGGGIWKRDVIKNPEGNLSKEGHRSNKCGDAEHWVIWVGTDGVPYRMDEIKSGATGGTLPTIIYHSRYNLSSEEIYGMQPSDTDLVWRYSQNFIDPMPWTEIQIGQRLYWTTQNGGQVWYHTGIPYKSTPTFMIFVDGIGYPLIAGESVEISDLLPGIHEISEDADTAYYLGEITSTGEITGQNEWTVNIVINEGEDTYIDWPNVVITPPPENPPNPPPPPEVSTNPPEEPEETETPAPEETETPVPEETEIPEPEETETPIPEETETAIPEKTEEPTPSPTPEDTEVPEKETPVPTPEETATVTPWITDPPTPIVTDTPALTHAPTYTPAPTRRPTNTPVLLTPEPTVPPTAEPVLTPTVEPTEEPTSVPTSTPRPKPTPTATPEPPEFPIHFPKIPKNIPQPKVPKPPFFEVLDNYKTALGITLMINHVGDCFD